MVPFGGIWIQKNYAMRNVLKDFLYFSRGERRGVWLLCFLILLVVCAGPAYRYWRDGRSQPSASERAMLTALQQEYADFERSLRDEEQRRAERRSYEKRPDAVLRPFFFDPNTANSADFRRMGLPGWMARNIVRYRAAGGRFRRAEDFRKIYGLTDEQYAVLQPYIRLAPADSARGVPRLFLPRADTDSVVRPFKYPAGVVVDLNRADTAELQKIPGIGSGIARLIAGYRQRLGGFYRIEQLGEINLDVGQLRAWFSIDTTAIRRINLNRVGVDRLRRHPYFNFYQAKAIVEYRKKRGPLRNMVPFFLHDDFTKADLEKMSHYICFE